LRGLRLDAVNRFRFANSGSQNTPPFLTRHRREKTFAICSRGRRVVAAECLQREDCHWHGWHTRARGYALFRRGTVRFHVRTAFNFTVTAVDGSGNVVTSYSGVVHFISTDGQAVLPADSTLTNGTGSFKAMMTNLGPQHMTATDTSTAITGTSSSINVLPARSFGEYGPEVLRRRT